MKHSPPPSYLSVSVTVWVVVPLVAVCGAGGGVVVVVGVVLAGRAAPVPAPVPQPLLGRARQDGLREHRHRALASGGELASLHATIHSELNSIIQRLEQQNRCFAS